MSRTADTAPELSVVVVVYNMPREAPRTLQSLSAGYQRHIDPDEYEVIVVDNGSRPPLDPQLLAGLHGNFRLLRIDEASPSPAHAINRGIAAARGDVIGVMIDGARLATPGLLHFARHGIRLYETAVVATLGWYLGPGFQRDSMRDGYDQAREDALLRDIDWPQDGYRLFEVGAMDESSEDGWFEPISESNALFLRREVWASLSGVDERFDAPGGGLINLDTFSRALELPQAKVVILLGEATFHQVHGGTSTNAPPDRQRENIARWLSQYASIRGQRFPLRSTQPPTYIGTLPKPALARMVRAALRPRKERDLKARAWSRLMTMGRRIRDRVPSRYGLRRTRPRAPRWQPAEAPPDPRRAEYHLALGDAHRRFGEREAAISSYHAALECNPTLEGAHYGLALLRLPGDGYLVWLERLYGSLAPATVLEIGIFEGASLALLRPPTIAIGVDPHPIVASRLKARTHLFAETSDEFFARRRLGKLLGGRPLSVGFIDGLHLFEQVLTDFIHVETWCGPRSVILIHDTVPLDEPTQSRTRKTHFHTGDVWKAVLCLRHYRPDLDIFTIATPPSGLTVVTGLDPASRVLADSYEEAVARFVGTPFSAVADALDTSLNIVPNDWNLVHSRLTARGVF
jgi:hypothetical protein